MSSRNLTKARYSEIGSFYAITTVTLGREHLFSDPEVARAVIGEVDRASKGDPFETLAWVLMPDHLHWLVELRQKNLSAGMQAFKSRSARAINQVSCGQGPVWQPGFYDHRIRNEMDLQLQARYIIENPVRAGLALRAGEYPYAWSRWPIDVAHR